MCSRMSNTVDEDEGEEAIVMSSRYISISILFPRLAHTMLSSQDERPVSALNRLALAFQDRAVLRASICFAACAMSVFYAASRRRSLCPPGVESGV